MFARPLAWPCLLIVLAGCGQESPAPRPTSSAVTSATTSPPSSPPARGANRKRTVYVPAYSHLRTSRNNPTLYSITLSVRNVDPTASVKLTHVDYFDTSGHRVRSYLSTPQTLAPLETAEFFVESNDDAGGSGANFLVYWEGPSDAHALLTEAVMVGFIGAGYSTFSSRGVELPARPDIPEGIAPAAASGSAPSPAPTSEPVFDGY